MRFNSLFEMQIIRAAMGVASYVVCFNSLFEMPVYTYKLPLVFSKCFNSLFEMRLNFLMR